MPTQEVIDAKVAIGKAYYCQLLDDHILNLMSGCNDCSDLETMVCLMEVIDALEYDINDEYTLPIFEKLMNLIGSYSGAGVISNPYVSIPNSTIVFPYDDRPEPVTISWSDMTLDGVTPTVEANRYDNPTWAGFNPMMELQGVAFVRGINYDLLPTGGFVSKGDTPFIYDGQTFIVYNFNIA